MVMLPAGGCGGMGRVNPFIVACPDTVPASWHMFSLPPSADQRPDPWYTALPSPRVTPSEDSNSMVRSAVRGAVKYLPSACSTVTPPSTRACGIDTPGGNCRRIHSTAPPPDSSQTPTTHASMPDVP